MSNGQRAAKKLRLYVKANRHSHLWTLTFREQPGDRGAVGREIRRFFEAMRRQLGRRPLAAVVERGKLNGRWHVHFTVNWRIPHGLVARLWGRGYVFVRGPSVKKKSWKAATLSKYLAKYVGKDIDEGDAQGGGDRAQGEHRYYVTQGFRPVAWKLDYARIGFAAERMRGLYGQPDAEGAFGDWENGTVFGMWFRFPEHLWHPPPQYARGGYVK